MILTLFLLLELPVVHATYLFESRISLLLRISQRPEYAGKLVDFAIMETMKELTFLDERLPHNVSQDEGKIVGVIEFIYRTYQCYGRCRTILLISAICFVSLPK